MILDPGLVQWMIDTGSRPSVADDRSRFLTYNRFLTVTPQNHQRIFVATLAPVLLALYDFFMFVIRNRDSDD